jgi:hypothetical protein
MPNPHSLNAAFGLARIKEYILNGTKTIRKMQDLGKPSILGLPKIDPKTDPKPKILVQRISPTQMRERRKKGICSNCDEKWHVGHKCKTPKLFLMERL